MIFCNCLSSLVGEVHFHIKVLNSDVTNSKTILKAVAQNLQKLSRGNVTQSRGKCYVCVKTGTEGRTQAKGITEQGVEEGTRA